VQIAGQSSAPLAARRARELLRADLQRLLGRSVSSLDPRQGRPRLLHERFGLPPVFGLGECLWRGDRPHRDDGCAAAVSIEDGSDAGLAGWGWQDDTYGALGTPIYFATSGTQNIRVQQREDGISIDQIVLSSAKYTSVAPGARKNDATILPR